MSKIILRSFEDETKRRKRIRLIFIAISIPFIIILSLFSFKIATMFINTNAGVNAYKTGEYEQATNSFDIQAENNFIQSWLVYFNIGTTETENSEYLEGINNLQTALSLVETDLEAECTVRANLAIAYERYGDQFANDGNSTQADINYALSVETFESAPPECFPPSGGSTSEQGESLEQTGERSNDKQSGSENGTGGSSDGNSQPEEQTAEERIQEQLEQSQRDREAIENLDRESEGSNGNQGEPYEKPW